MEMKIKYVILILTITGFLFSAAAQTSAIVKETFDEGNRLYQKEDYAGAIEQYLKIIAMGYESGELHFNLGNSYFKTGNLGRSILHFEKAKKLLPKDEDLQHNLNLLSMRIADKIETPRLAIWKVFDSVVELFSVNALAIITLILFLITLGLASVYLYLSRGMLKKLTFYSSFGILMLCLIFGSLFTMRVVKLETTREGVILVDKVEILSAPDAGAKGLFALHEGVKIRIDQKLSEWAEISLADGKKGWVRIECFEEI